MAWLICTLKNKKIVAGEIVLTGRITKQDQMFRDYLKQYGLLDGEYFVVPVGHSSVFKVKDKKIVKKIKEFR